MFILFCNHEAGARRMESFCPLCAKSGVKRRVKAFQINLEEAVYVCESEECPWPIGYEELTFFARSALTCNWEEQSAAKEDMPTLMELSMYTPPVTPAGEFSKELTEIAGTECSSSPSVGDKVGALPQCDFIASNKSPKLLGSVNSTEDNSGIMNEQVAGVNVFRSLPKITNIEKTSINLTIFPNIGEHCNNRKTQKQEQSRVDATIMDSFKNFDIYDNACTEFDLNTQYKTEGEQNESGKVQSDATVSGVETNFGADTLPETMKTLVDVNVTNSLNATNESVRNISTGDIDTLLDDILNSESHIPADINDDWLNSLDLLMS